MYVFNKDLFNQTELLTIIVGPRHKHSGILARLSDNTNAKKILGSKSWLEHQFYILIGSKILGKDMS
jgi:hypothetical protein